jgi:hypothetical protein
MNTNACVFHERKKHSQPALFTNSIRVFASIKPSELIFLASKRKNGNGMLSPFSSFSTLEAAAAVAESERVWVLYASTALSRSLARCVTYHFENP